MNIFKINYIDDIFSEDAFVEASLDLQADTLIIVLDNSIMKIAKVINKVLTPLQENKKEEFPKFVRIATKKDKQQEKNNVFDSTKALSYAQEVALELDLDMHFIAAFYTFDRKQLFIFYTADNRIDFRELAKMLAQRYKTRIELRQVGVRDRAKKIGGLGPCGLFLCCSSFLTEFASVSINMAKNQYLTLNPTKINGICGRLLCCLNYENDVYTDLKKGLPNIGNLVETEAGLGKVVEVDVFKRKYKVEIKDKGIVEIAVNE